MVMRVGLQGDAVAPAAFTEADHEVPVQSAPGARHREARRRQTS
jgi:hypothetical protein